MNVFRSLYFLLSLLLCTAIYAFYLMKPEFFILDLPNYNLFGLTEVLTSPVVFLMSSLVILAILIIKWRERSINHMLNLQESLLEACNDNSDWNEWLIQGEYLLSEGKCGQAIASFDKSYEENPSEAGTWPHSAKAKFLKAECLIILGKRDEAQKSFNEGLEILHSAEISWLKPVINKVRTLLEA